MIIDLQRRISEVGRIRIGQQVANTRGKGTRPAKLTTFRLTSPDRNRIAQAARLYGGQPAEWEAPAGKQWEIITESDALPVIVPPSDMAFSQHYELWSGGGCQRRCDGRYETITDQPCVCDPDKRECSIHTRLSVMLRDLPGLGVWRIDTSGYYAAVELQGAVEVVQMAAGRGQMLPAALRLEQRMIKRPGSATKRFAVPVLDIEISPAQLLGGAKMPALSDPGVVAIEPPRQQIDSAAPLTPPPPLTPVPQSVPETPMTSVAEQATAVREKRTRRNAAQPVPRTGLAPRTAAQAAGREPEPPPSDEPPPDEDPAPHPAAGPQPDSEPDAPATAPQYTIINKGFRDAGITEPEHKRVIITHILGFEVSTMTISEAHTVIKAFNNAADLPQFCQSILAGPPADDEPADAEPADADEMVTDKQKTKLAIIRDERYPKTIAGRAKWFKWVGVQIGHEVSSNTELTKAEAMVLLDLLENDPDTETTTATTEGE